LRIAWIQVIRPSSITSLDQQAVISASPPRNTQSSSRLRPAVRSVTWCWAGKAPIWRALPVSRSTWLDGDLVRAGVEDEQGGGGVGVQVVVVGGRAGQTLVAVASSTLIRHFDDSEIETWINIAEDWRTRAGSTSS
jgi:hypothetical protein